MNTKVALTVVLSLMSVANAGEPESWILAFGDSIMAGYSPTGDLRRKNLDLVSLVAKAAKEHSGYSDLETRNVAVPGMTTTFIRRTFEKLYSERQATADLLLINGGGNNALSLRSKSIEELCDERTYEYFVPSMLSDWFRMLNILRARRPSDKASVMLGLYFPPVNEQLAKSCGDVSVAEKFLPYLAEANFRLRELALRDKLFWVDPMPLLNCEAEYRASCEIEPLDTLLEYQDRLLSLLRSGRFRDPSEIDGGLVQRDNVHPNAAGHQRIADNIVHALGF